jgi:putative colanic acid biosynthesis acetyltransferase WcaF
MLKTDLSKFNNKWYKPGNRIKRICWYYINIFFFLNPANPFNNIKIFWLIIFGAKVGKGVIIKPAVNIKYPWNLEIGNYVWIGEKVWIDNLAPVKIGNHVCISQGAMLLCGNHNYKNVAFDLIVKEIKLEDGVWIGAKAIVCPGVKCNSHALLTVGSVATSDLEAYSIYSGNPAVKIKNREINN